jgi:hypothetical protein
MNEQGEVLRPVECAMALESGRASIELLRCINALIEAGNALAELRGPTWSHPALDRWDSVVERGIEARETVEAYEIFRPLNWW